MKGHIRRGVDRRSADQVQVLLSTSCSGTAPSCFIYKVPTSLHLASQKSASLFVSRQARFSGTRLRVLPHLVPAIGEVLCVWRPRCARRRPSTQYVGRLPRFNKTGFEKFQNDEVLLKWTPAERPSLCMDRRCLQRALWDSETGVVLISSNTLCFDRSSRLTEPWWVTQNYYIGSIILKKYLQHALTVLDVSHVAVSDTLLFTVNSEPLWNTTIL
jgi:hypothetical protein